MELSCLRIKIFWEGTFRAEKVSYISGKWNIVALSLKSSYIFFKKGFLIF